MEWCVYASKPCWNLRCVKTNGELHRFCLYHRAKANASQRRWQSRRESWAANTSTQIDVEEQDQECTAPVKKRKGDKPLPTKEMRQRRKRMLHDQRQARVASLPPPPEYWQVHTDQAESANAVNASSDDLELMQWLSDEEIAYLLGDGLHLTVNPSSCQLVP